MNGSLAIGIPLKVNSYAPRCLMNGSLAIGIPLKVSLYTPRCLMNGSLAIGIPLKVSLYTPRCLLKVSLGCSVLLFLHENIISVVCFVVRVKHYFPVIIHFVTVCRSLTSLSRV